MAETSVAEVMPAGFFNRNLCFLDEVDNAQISYMKGEQGVELRTAPDCMKPVIRNIEAILTFIQPLYKRRGLFMMEQIHNEFPENINTLANLIEMKTNLNMDIKIQEEKLKTLRSKDCNRLEEARCRLEIGYVLMTDLHIEAQKSVEEKLMDVHKHLELKSQMVTGNRRIIFKHAFQQWDDATTKIKHLLTETCLHGTKLEQNEAITYFKLGMDLLEPGTEKELWRHQLARTHSRLGTADRNVSKTTERKHHMCCALKNFLECISEISKVNQKNDPLKVYIARSYAYVGHLIATRHKEIKGQQEPIPSFIEQNDDFRCLWNNPMKAFEMAYESFNRDRVVHNRHGLTLTDRRATKDKKENYEKNVDQAIKHFNESLKIEKMHNWFAYSLLAHAYLEKYRVKKQRFLEETSRQNKKEPEKGDLDDAIKNGELCLQQRVTSRTLLDIIEAFYLKGMKPKQGKDGLDIIVDESCITVAYEYIQRAFNHHDCKEHEKLKVFSGKCLFHKGDKTNGIEAMLDILTKPRNSVTEPHYFKELMIMMLNEFRVWKDNKRNEVKIRQRRQKLRKIWCVLSSGKVTYTNRLRHPLIGIVNMYPHELIFMIREVFSFKKRSPKDQELVNECLNALENHHGKDVNRRLKELLAERPEESDEIDNHKAETSDPYQCCICYSREDAIWTKTFIEDRKLHLNGKLCSRVDQLEKGENMKYLFIISDSFNNDEDCMAMLSAVKGKYKTSNRLIPVLINNFSSLPLLLEDVHPVDCTGLRNSAYKNLEAALIQQVNDNNVQTAKVTPNPTVIDVPRAELTPDPMVIDVPGAEVTPDPTVKNVPGAEEGTASSDSESIEVEESESKALKRRKKDDQTEEQAPNEEPSMEAQEQAESEIATNGTESKPSMWELVQSENNELDSGFDSQNA
ncbi:uncharacterized protein LOC132564603 [Ylistrum balloti]|uniref:uncharacterized protein LOC132564603 n=1 Tax=Ylistrum balloti TaxID=509963 RepID=UPI002905B571|nr:uncharacterized protein LOC132564603 [Ylistrum balloti]